MQSQWALIFFFKWSGVTKKMLILALWVFRAYISTYTPFLLLVLYYIAQL